MSSVFSAVYQGGLFGISGMMPQRYTGAVMTGQVSNNNKLSLFALIASFKSNIKVPQSAAEI